MQIAHGYGDAHKSFLDGEKQMLNSISQSDWEQISEKCEKIPRNIKLYLIITFELLHNLYLEMSKLVQECRIEYLPSHGFRQNTDKQESENDHSTRGEIL